MKIELSIDEGAACALFKDPRNKEIKHAETFLSFYEINKLKRGNANIRPPEEKKRPYLAMISSVEKNPEQFHLKNRGITYICTNLEYDSDRKVLTVTLPETDEIRVKKGEIARWGIADGGHTFDVITKTVANEKDFQTMREAGKWDMPFDRVHFISTKDLTHIEPIVEALNTSTQVKEMSIHEYQNRYAGIKVALEKAGFPVELVAFTENEGKEWDITEVVQRMSCFLPERWLSHQPLQAYKSKNRAMKMYLDPETQHDFEEIYPVIKDVLTLPEYIEAEFSNQFLKEGTNLLGIRTLKKPKNRPGTPYTTHHKLNLAITLPLAAAFRTLLIKRGDVYDWVIDYKSIFKDCAEDLFDLFSKKVTKSAQLSHLAGDPDYWGAAMRLVMQAKDVQLSSGPIVRKNKQVTMEELVEQSKQEVG